MIAVINASPLIYLGKLGILDLIQNLFSEILTSDVVRKEVLTSKNAPEIPILKNAFSSYLKIINVKDQGLLNRLQDLNIHVGEATVIVIATELKQTSKEPVVIIDDLTAREIAKTFGIPVIGTIGVLLSLMKKNFLGKSIGRSKIEKLVEYTDFRISTKLYSKILRQIKEI
ncbi:MAG: DUF3368 domain-containing protein [Candidatus Helarchaeota archaeon]